MRCPFVCLCFYFLSWTKKAINLHKDEELNDNFYLTTTFISEIFMK